MTDIITLTPGELIKVTREITVDYPVVLRPFVNKGYNCQGCRKRHHDNRHIINGTLLNKEKEYRFSSWNNRWSRGEVENEVSPRIRFCGTEECFNMILLKNEEILAKYKKIMKEPYSSYNDLVTCKKCHCARNKPTAKNPEPIFYQAWGLPPNEGDYVKEGTFCSTNCFKTYFTKEQPW